MIQSNHIFQMENKRWTTNIIPRMKAVCRCYLLSALECVSMGDLFCQSARVKSHWLLQLYWTRSCRCVCVWQHAMTIYGLIDFWNYCHDYFFDFHGICHLGFVDFRNTLFHSLLSFRHICRYHLSIGFVWDYLNVGGFQYTEIFVNCETNWSGTIIALQ